MLISFHKGSGRHALSCLRSDGTSTRQESGPGLPQHDLAHYVAERALRLPAGFFGMVAAGRSLRELSDAEVIRTLGDEALVAEVFARAIGSLATGACGAEEFVELVKAELGDRLSPPLREISLEQVQAMNDHYTALIAEWRALPDGGVLSLRWEIGTEMRSGRTA